MTPAFLASRQHPGVDGAAAALLHACTVVGICLGCLAPPMNARGPARGCRREEMTVSISPDLPCGETDPHARGYGCAREALCAARRGEGARARETVCAYRGRRSRDARALDDLWVTRIVWSTSDRRDRVSWTFFKRIDGRFLPSPVVKSIKYEYTCLGTVGPRTS